MSKQPQLFNARRSAGARHTIRALPAIVAAALSAAGCSGHDHGDIPDTVALSPDCNESFSPTFPEVSERVLRQTCAAGGSSCHSTEGAQGGLALESPDVAYGALVEGVGGHDLVVAGNSESSELMVRLEITGEDWSMPPGNQLDAGARCAIQKWIDAGAARD